RDNAGPWRYGPVREALTHAMDQWLDAARSVVNDGTGLSTSLTFAQDRAVWHTEFDLRNPRSEGLRAFAAATTGQPPVPADLLAHLLPDGFLYLTASEDDRPLRPVIAPLVELGNQILQNERSLAPADAAALRQVLDVLPLLDQGMLAASYGF